jgi:hypothetical protein
MVDEMILGYWDIGYWDIGILGYWILGYWDIGILFKKYPNIQYPNIFFSY